MTSQQEDFGETKSPTKCQDITILSVTSLANIVAGVSMYFAIKQYGDIEMGVDTWILVAAII